MKTIAGGLILGIVLVAAGALFWSQAAFTRRVADAHRELATLRYQPADALDSTAEGWFDQGWRAAALAPLAADVERYRARTTYWLEHYPALTPLLEITGPQAVKDSEVLFAAANAAFRESAPEVGDRKDAVERLDSVMQAYADVLRLDPSHADASYNYEFTARIRDLIAKGRPAPHHAPNPTDAIKADLPVGITVHGRPGMPPPEVDMGEFKTLTPMKFEEREEQADPGRGAVQRRKG